MEKDMVIQHDKHKNLLVLIRKGQDTYGYLPEEYMVELAKSLNISLSEVYGTATFYSFLCTTVQGRNIIRVCKSIPCFLKNYRVIAETIENKLGIRPGETTADGRFSFHLTNCIGACDRAPAMMVNNDVHVDLTPEKISRILEEYK
jgi:NADH-quinone oxidoreductase subunit E